MKYLVLPKIQFNKKYTRDDLQKRIRIKEINDQLAVLEAKFKNSYKLSWMRLNRPKIHSIQSFDFDWPVHHAQFKDIPIYTLSLKDNPLIHIEIVFESGELTESRFLAAHFTAKMLLESTPN